MTRSCDVPFLRLNLLYAGAVNWEKADTIFFTCASTTIASSHVVTIRMSAAYHVFFIFSFMRPSSSIFSFSSGVSCFFFSSGSSLSIQKISASQRNGLSESFHFPFFSSRFRCFFTFACQSSSMGCRSICTTLDSCIDVFPRAERIAFIPSVSSFV